MSEKEYKEKCNNMFAQNSILLHRIDELEEQIEKMKNDQKTAFIKGVRHFAKAMKKYDQTEGAWTDYFEHTVDTVLKRELAVLNRELAE